MKTRFAALGTLLIAFTVVPLSHPYTPSDEWQATIDAAGLSAPAVTRHPTLTSHQLIVSPRGPYTTIQSALDESRDGDEIIVQSGVYRGAISVDKPVRLTGVNYPVIDGEGKGIVVTLNVAGIEMHGFEVRGSGLEYDNDHAGIRIGAPRIIVENNRLNDVLFGILVFKAEDSIVRGNDISGKAELDVGAKGDAIRVWYSPRAQIVQNHIHDSRDVVMWYSTDLVIRENTIERGRYGLHLMFTGRSIIERNRVLDNSVGIYSMFSDDIVVRENLVRGQRGPSGYALGFKDTDNLDVANNVLVDNRGGVYLDGTPFSPQGFSHFHDNILAFNDVGIIVLPAVRGNIFKNNSFWENVEQVAVQGGGLLGANEWRGNYWSDYAGFDANGDDIGDVPYRAERFFENMMDREPYLRALLYSPATQAIEFAAESFPLVKPQPKFVDPTPRVQPNSIPMFAAPSRVDSGRLAVGALGLIALAGLCGVLAFTRGGRKGMSDMRQVTGEGASDEGRAGVDKASETSSRVTDHPSLSIRAGNVTKRYGNVAALDGITFDARAGEALALWGPNGAGKTTLIKAMLGLIEFQGAMSVRGQDAQRAGKAARRAIGYVPQETGFYDWSVQATMEFYARLKKTDAARITPLLQTLGMTEHRSKSVAALSGGLKQRLALAIALLADPPILLFDEPTASLDARTQSDYLALIAALRKEDRTIIFASHRLEEVEALADRVLVLEAGKLVDVTTPEELRSRLMPEIEMTLWIDEAQRSAAFALLEGLGLLTHFNGRGTIVVRVPNEKKIDPLRMLNDRGISVLNFEIERGKAWN